MKRITRLLAPVFLMIILAAAVAASVSVTYNFRDAQSGNPVDHVDVLVYPCLDSGCDNLDLDSPLPGSGDSGARSYLTIIYPTSLATQHGYAAYYFADGHVPMEYRATWHGTGSTSFDIAFTKKADCSSPIQDFNVNVDSGVASMTAGVQSAFNEIDNNVGYVPEDYREDFYSSEVEAEFRIYDSNNELVFQDTAYANIFMDSSVSVSSSEISLDPGDYRAEIETTVPDSQCYNTISVIEEEEFTVEEAPPAAPLNISLTADPSEGEEPLDVILNCTAAGGEGHFDYSLYENGSLFFSTETGSRQLSINRVFSEGLYNITCSVEDSAGEEDSGSVAINVTGEQQFPQCSDGMDNDNDGLIDFPTDPGCESPEDDDESDEELPECSDGVDNDNDGLIDYPEDPGCEDEQDDDESDEELPQCSDGIDNDGDGLVDMDDPDCLYPEDDDESGENETGAPEVALLYPSDYSVFNTSNITFAYGVHDDSSEELDCTLYTNITGSFGPAAEQTTQNHFIDFFRLNNISDGTYTWNVLCSDGTASSFAPRSLVFTISTSPYEDIPAEVNITADPSEGEEPLEVDFSSSSAGNSPISYSWDFGDGSTSGQENPSHAYESSGAYTAHLTITDADGDTASDSVVITVEEAGEDEDEEPEEEDEDYELYIGRILLYSQCVDEYGENHVRPGEELFVNVYFENTGDRELERLEYRALVMGLGVSDSTVFDLGEGESTTRQLRIDIPEDSEPGVYDVQITAHNEQVSRTKYRPVFVVEELG